MRGHYADDELGTMQGLRQVVGGAHAFGNLLAGEKQIIDVPGIDRFAHFRLMRPEADPMSAAAPSHDGKRRAPCSRSDDGNLAHLRPAPNLFSVPARSRRILG